MAVWEIVDQSVKDDEDEQGVQVKKASPYHRRRRILSEIALEAQLPWHFEQGVSYHCLSWGDVDALTYLRVIAKQQRLEYVALSTWVMAQTDIREIFDWVDMGVIGRVDMYLGEIFPTSYEYEYAILLDECTRHGSRLVVFRNHSKLMVIFGERFDVLIESSANINTNPRMENTVITTDPDLALWYKQQLDTIKPFNTDYAQPPVYERRRDHHGAPEDACGSEQEAPYQG
ncbi:MAG: hypothetical protein IJ668_00140 [Selenomonadaceae bacterium]|nr:hypothetical protein [Selenomonadaceae bacterium]